MTYKIKEIGWELIKPVWEEKLWPKRKSAIEPYSAMVCPLDLDNYPFDIDEYNTRFAHQPAYFFGAFLDDELVGVNSGHGTRYERINDIRSVRSRGLWVDPEHRGNGLGQKLLRAIEQPFDGWDMVWSLPRMSALRTYEAADYAPWGSEINKGMEFGPNIFAAKYL